MDINEYSITSESLIRVLLVDDQSIVAEAIKRMLAEESDMEFHYTDDPSTAINKAIEVNATIILQDLVMPDMDGMTLVRYYRANNKTSDIPVIVLSSKEDPVIKSDAFYNGANDYLVKLPDKIELIARIRSHAKHYLLKLERDAAFLALREMQKQLEATNAELQRLSCQDGLTGLSNRRTFDIKLEEDIRDATSDKHDLSLILMDIDHFKKYNDSYGHLGGDECLKSVARCMKDIFTRPNDLIARYGGEEFAIILPSTALKDATFLANKLNKAVQDMCIEHNSSDTSDHVTVSLGVTSLTLDNPESPEALIEKADQALYSAKENGRNQACVSED